MKEYTLLSIRYSTVHDFYRQYNRFKFSRIAKSSAKSLFTCFLTIFLLLAYSFPTAQTGIVTDLENKLTSFQELQNAHHERQAKEIRELADIIRYATDFRLAHNQASKYAGFIYHASKLYKVNSLEIVALVMAESSFNAEIINEQSGDFGLGQINWRYWGIPNGLTPGDLLDPAINIVMTCKIFDHYDRDFSKYHGGHGIKSKAYLINVKRILSSLISHAKEIAPNYRLNKPFL